MSLAMGGYIQYIKIKIQVLQGNEKTIAMQPEY